MLHFYLYSPVSRLYCYMVLALYMLNGWFVLWVVYTISTLLSIFPPIVMLYCYVSDIPNIKQKHCTFLLWDIESASVDPYDRKSGITVILCLFLSHHSCLSLVLDGCHIVHPSFHNINLRSCSILIAGCQTEKYHAA